MPHEVAADCPKAEFDQSEWPMPSIVSRFAERSLSEAFAETLGGCNAMDNFRDADACRGACKSQHKRGSLFQDLSMQYKRCCRCSKQWQLW